MELLFAQLEGEAADWYARATQKNPPPDWTETVKLLLDRFQPPDYAARNFVALNNRSKYLGR